MAGVILAFATLLTACDSQKSNTLQGIVEVESTRVVAPISGKLLSTNVKKGEHIKAGDLLFVLDSETERAQEQEALARVEQARAQAEDLNQGKRPQEIAVLEAHVLTAQAHLAKAQQDYRRQSELLADGFVSAAAVDAYRSARDAAQAEVRAAQAQVDAARLSARQNQKNAAQASVAAGEAQLAQRQWVVAQKSVFAPIDAQVKEVYFRSGEWVSAGAPVVSLHAQQGVKIRFYVPQHLRAQLRIGGLLQAACDGCSSPVPARISYIATDAEYTPPVLYTKEHRDKLVWLAEAVLVQQKDQQVLLSGQIVDLQLDPQIMESSSKEFEMQEKKKRSQINSSPQQEAQAQTSSTPLTLETTAVHSSAPAQSATAAANATAHQQALQMDFSCKSCQ